MKLVKKVFFAGIISIGLFLNLHTEAKNRNFRTLKMESTAYTHTGNPTKTGIYPLYEGIVAVDPAVIPLHSEVYVEGYGYAKAEDTGEDIKGYRIDVFKNSYSEAIQYGRRKVKVTIYENK